MTPEQMELLSDMISDKVYDRVKHFFDNQNIIVFEPIPPKDFLHKNIDAFGNIKFTEKEILKDQLDKLEIQAKRLLKEEKYELLQELKELHAKIKNDHDKL